MNEQRLQAYYQLIKSLLSCPSGEEAAILQANTGLLDAGFLQTLEAVAEYFAQQGNENNAGWLRNLAIKLGAEFNSNRTTPDLETYGRFLAEILRTTIESNSDTQVIYSLLARNTDKLNDNFAEILRRWGTHTLVESELETAEYLARAIGNFSSLISQFLLGNKASNMEIAITGYEIISTIYTRTNFPQDWAMTQYNLGNAYGDRIRGDKAENLEQAIAAYSAALQIYTRTDFPQDWAGTQNNLGNAYGERIRGDKAENLEMAIAAYSAALQIYTRADFPQAWAMTQNNLGTAYRNRIRGDKAENLEMAIAACSAALQIYTRTDFPQDWAGTQNNLGMAYRNRIRGDKAENLEQAIAACSAALQIYTRTDFPQDWAGMQNNLGMAYRNRIRGDKAENLEMAIAAYSAALQIYTRADFPQNWAITQNNLSVAYYFRIRGDKADNLEQAIAACSAALEVRTRADFPQAWAGTQNNLGTAYRNRIRGDKAENLEMAIAAFSAALEVCTRPHQDWVMTQYNLGVAYYSRLRGDKAENLEMAITAFSAALEVCTRAEFPQKRAEILLSLGILYQNSNQFTLAESTFSSAIETIENLRDEILSGNESKLKQTEEWIQLYLSMVEVCLALKKDTAAIEYVERSKNRNLVEQILIRDQKNIFPAYVVTQLEKYRNEIAVGQYQLQNGKAENQTALAQYLQELRQQRNNLQDQYLPVGSSFKFEQFQKTLHANTVIIEWYINFDKIIAFIIKPQGQQLTIWQSQPEDLAAFINWGNEYLRDYYGQKDKWQNQLEECLKELANILHIQEILNLAQIPKDYKLILIPHRYLHLFPLHALPVGKSYLIDLFPNGVSYAPSCQLLQQVQQRKRPDFQSLFAIQNPTGDLNYTDLEVQVIQTYFNTANVLKKTAATLTAINNTDLNTYHCTHFSCHGYFNLTNPGKSALILANAPIADTPTKPDSERYLDVRLGETHDLEKCLTLDKIFALKLEKCRLVTLSACETGLIDIKNASDEYIGLPSGFLLAGSPSVVSSLWKVDDLSTSFLMIKFYENLFKFDNLEAGDIAIALKEAQNWLRNLTIEGLKIFKEEHKPEIKKVLAQLRKGQRKIVKESWKRIKQRQPLPFANPYYWAGFTASGL